MPGSKLQYLQHTRWMALVALPLVALQSYNYVWPLHLFLSGPCEEWIYWKSQFCWLTVIPKANFSHQTLYLFLAKCSCCRDTKSFCCCLMFFSTCLKFSILAKIVYNFQFWRIFIEFALFKGLRKVGKNIFISPCSHCLIMQQDPVNIKLFIMIALSAAQFWGAPRKTSTRTRIQSYIQFQVKT